MRMQDKDFEERGYKQFPPSAVDPDAVKYLYQKKCKENDTVKYFITARKWEFPQHEFDGFEYTVQLFQKDTHSAVDLLYHRDWDIDSVEQNVEALYRTGLFEPESAD